MNFSSAMEVACEYGVEKCRFYSDKYTCVMSNLTITEPNTRIFKVHGVHLQGKSDNDVEALVIRYCKVEFLPRGLHRIFPNLQALFLRSTKIHKITREDLKCLKKLTGFRVVYGELTSLPNDLFLDLPNLKYISFYKNEINKLNSQLFTSEMRDNLHFASFDGNDSISTRFDPNNIYGANGVSLEELLAKVDSNCKPPEGELCDFFSNLSHGLAKLWESKQFSNLKIIAGSQTSPVHKHVLIAQSAVFERIFDNKFKEGHENEMRIDFDAEVVEEFLQYFYSSTISKEELAMDLYLIAKEYEVTSLTETCQNIILDNLDESNALEVFAFGQLCNSKEIRKFAIDEIRKKFTELFFADLADDRPRKLKTWIKSFRSIKSEMSRGKFRNRHSDD